MEAHVNENCIGCGLCVSACPMVFSMQGSVAVAREEDIPETELARAQEARDGCPVEAIDLG